MGSINEMGLRFPFKLVYSWLNSIPRIASNLAESFAIRKNRDILALILSSCRRFFSPCAYDPSENPSTSLGFIVQKPESKISNHRRQIQHIELNKVAGFSFCAHFSGQNFLHRIPGTQLRKAR